MEANQVNAYTNELATLRRLKQQVEVAIGCIELGQVKQDDSYSYRSFANGYYYDFRIGDFHIKDDYSRERL